MEGDQYGNQGQQQFSRSQMPPASSSTLNHLLSTPASYAPQMAHPQYFSQQQFDPRNPNPMPMYGMGQRSDMNFMMPAQLQNPPGMQMDRNSSQLPEWNPQQQQMQQGNFPGFPQGNFVPGGQSQGSDFGEPSAPPPKKKKRNRSKERSAAVSEPPRASAQQLQEQVLQQQQSHIPGMPTMGRGPEHFLPNMMMRPENPNDQFQQRFYPRPGVPQPPRPFGMPNAAAPGQQFPGQQFQNPGIPNMRMDSPQQSQNLPGAEMNRNFAQQMQMQPPPNQSPYHTGPEISWAPQTPQSSNDPAQFDDKSSAVSAGARSPFSTQNSEASFGESVQSSAKSPAGRASKAKQNLPPATPQSHSSMGDIDGDSNSSWSKPSVPEPRSSSHSGSSKPNEKLNLLYEMGSEPDRRPMVEQMIRLCEEIGSPLINIPIISKVHLDLYKFYKVVQERGGYVEVQRNKGWKDMAGLVGITQPNANTAYTLKKQYMKFILPYEARYDRGGMEVEALIQMADAASKSPSKSNGGSGSSRNRKKAASGDNQNMPGPGGFDGAPQGPPLFPPQQMPFPPPMMNPGDPNSGMQFQQSQQGPFGADPQLHQQQPPFPQQPPNSSDAMPPHNQQPYWPGQQGPMGPPVHQVGPGQSAPYPGYQDSRRMLPPRNPEEQMIQRQQGPRPSGYPPNYPPQNMPPSQPPYGFNPERASSTQESAMAVPDERRITNGSMAIPNPAQMQSPATKVEARHIVSSGTFPPVEASQPLKPVLPPNVRVGPTPQVMPAQPSNPNMMPNGTHAISFPPGCVEATNPIMKSHRKLNARDAGIVGNDLDLWKLFMRLRSGLLAESAWAFDVINICAADDSQCKHLLLSNSPAGFLDTILDWMGVSLNRLLKLCKRKVEQNGVKCSGSGRSAAHDIRLHPEFFPDCDYYRTGFLLHADVEQEIQLAPLSPGEKQEAVNVNIPEPPNLNLKAEGDAEISRRCLAISTCIRNLSAIAGNEAVLAKNQRLLYLLGWFILFNHQHVSSPDVTNLDAEDELQAVKDFTPPNVFWIQEPLEHLRENFMVTLANIAGYVDLADSKEMVCRPMLEGLIHWVVCSSSSAQDTMYSVSGSHAPGELSPRSLSLEALSKLTVTESNVDLLAITPDFLQLSKFIDHLIQWLPSSATTAAPIINYLCREYALVILASLVNCDERITRIFAEHPFGVEYLIVLLEEGDRYVRILLANAKIVQMGGNGIEVLDLPGTGSLVNSLMLRKAIELLCAIVEHNELRSSLKRWQSRFWDLVVDSRLSDQMIVSGLTRILFLLGSSDVPAAHEAETLPS